MKETERETALFSISNYAISPIQQYFLIVVGFELWFPIPDFDPLPLLYRVTHLLDSNLPLTSKDKFRIGLDLARPKRNFWFDVNRRFESTRCVTLYFGRESSFLTTTSLSSGSPTTADFCPSWWRHKLL